MADFVSSLQNAESTYIHVYITALRWVAPILACLILLRCILPLLSFRREPEIWGWLCLEDGKKLPITHWENIIGRSKRSDIVVNYHTIAPTHGVLTRYDDGSWTITATDAAGDIRVNGKLVDICALEPEDVISIGGVEMTLQPITKAQEKRLAQLRTRAANPMSSITSVVLLSAFQFLCMLAFLLGGDPEIADSVLLGFGGIAACQWALLMFYFSIRRTSFELETIAFFLCTMGMAAIMTVVPGEALKQLLAVFLGLAAFLLVGWCLRDLERAKKVRWLAAAAGIGFLLITLVFGQEYYGAKNWLVIGPFSLQPSELSKVCFVFIGASAMDRLVKKRNLILFIAYSVVICGLLALMNDFGTALIFFCAFLVVAYLRSGSIGTLALACTSLGFAGVVAMRFLPHALQRFTSWRHIWEVPLDGGFQQTRALMCMASGGLLGLGAGRGWMENLFAADSDMVVATISEEWGLLMVLLLVLCVIALAFFVIRSACVARSSFYTIGSCAAASIFLVQVILNALGTVDVLPLTGVTFPFLSNGGSSMICSWGLLAFIKAADTRQNASFAVRLVKKGRATDEQDC